MSVGSAGGSVGVDRLTGPDLGGFVPEEFGWPAEIGLIAVLEGPHCSTVTAGCEVGTCGIGSRVGCTWLPGSVR